jgi:HK97 family phage portal protein
LKSLTAALVGGLRPISIKALTVRSVSLLDHDFWANWGGTAAWTGESITAKGILQLGTAKACVQLLSGTVATLPGNINKRGKDGFPVPDTSHQLYELLHNQPNADMTAVSFWTAFVASLLLWGITYVEKQMSGETIIGLMFLLPDRVTRRRTSYGIWVWVYTDPVTGTQRDIPDERMWRMPAFSLDGINGLSAMQYGANVFGAAMAAGRASSETFKNGMRSPGLVTVDRLLTKEQRDELRAHIKKVGQEGGVMVFEKGSSYQQLSMNPDDAELLMTRDFNDVQICQWYQVPPHMVGITSKATSWGTGIEEMKEGFVAFVIRHLCVGIEQSVRKNLMTPVGRLTHSFEFALEGLLRGLSATRASFYATAVQNGWLTRNEVRRLEGKPPLPGGDVLTVQSNLVPLDQLGKAAPDMNARDALMAWLGIEPSAGAPAKE